MVPEPLSRTMGALCSVSVMVVLGSVPELLRARLRKAFSANLYVRLLDRKEGIAPGTVKIATD